MLPIGRRTEAAEILARAAAKHFEHLNWDQNRMVGLAMYADTAAQTHSVQNAAMLYELIEPYADQFHLKRRALLGHTRTYSAMLAATLAATSKPTSGLRFRLRLPSPKRGIRTWEARSELGWAEALAQRGDLDRARDHASRALELSRDHGFGEFEPRAGAIVASVAAVQP